MFEKGLLKGKRILVTGGGSGLGAAMGRRFLELGADLVICGRRLELLEATAANDEIGAKLEKAAPHCGTKPRTAAGDQDAFPLQQAFFKHGFTPIFISSSL